MIGFIIVMVVILSVLWFINECFYTYRKALIKKVIKDMLALSKNCNLKCPCDKPTVQKCFECENLTDCYIAWFEHEERCKKRK